MWDVLPPQVYVLTKRMLVNNWRNIAVFWLRLGMVGGCLAGPPAAGRGSRVRAVPGVADSLPPTPTSLLSKAIPARTHARVHMPTT